VSDQVLLLAEFSPCCSDTETDPTGCGNCTVWALLRMGTTAPHFTSQTSAIWATHSLILFK